MRKQQMSRSLLSHTLLVALGPCLSLPFFAFSTLTIIWCSLSISMLPFPATMLMIVAGSAVSFYT